MATKGGSKMFWIIGGLIVVAGSVGAYFLLRKPKDEGVGTDENDINADEKKLTETILGSDKKTYTAPSELNSKDKIKAFQDWLDNNKPCWLLDSDNKYKNLSKNVGKCDRNVGGKGYGSYGENTDNAWKSFGAEYIKSKDGKNIYDKAIDVAKDIFNPKNSYVKNILSSTQTDKTEGQLSTYKADFLKRWSNAIDSKKTSFVSDNVIYETKTGREIYKGYVKDMIVYATSTGQHGKQTSDLSSPSQGIIKGKNLGKVGVWKYVYNQETGQGYLLFYLSDKGIWVFENYTTKTKPSSSFSGNEMDLDMFSTFDNNFDLNL